MQKNGKTTAQTVKELTPQELKTIENEVEMYKKTNYNTGNQIKTVLMRSLIYRQPNLVNFETVMKLEKPANGSKEARE